MAPPSSGLIWELLEHLYLRVVELVVSREFVEIRIVPIFQTPFSKSSRESHYRKYISSGFTESPYVGYIDKNA